MTPDTLRLLRYQAMFRTDNSAVVPSNLLVNTVPPIVLLISDCQFSTPAIHPRKQNSTL